MARKARILVVDDEPNVSFTYRLILQQQGYEANAATSTEEACKRLEEGGIDLLICDLSLERQEDGFDVINYARSVDPEIEVILLTGYASIDANDRAERDGISVLFKPVDVQQLLDLIAGMLKTKQGIEHG